MKQSSSVNRKQISPQGDGDEAMTVLHAADGLRRLVEVWAAKKQSGRPVAHLLRPGLPNQFTATT
jgi:hypothetical protein